MPFLVVSVKPSDKDDDDDRQFGGDQVAFDCRLVNENSVQCHHDGNCGE